MLYQGQSYKGSKLVTLLINAIKLRSHTPTMEEDTVALGKQSYCDIDAVLDLGYQLSFISEAGIRTSLHCNSNKGW